MDLRKKKGTVLVRPASTSASSDQRHFALVVGLLEVPEGVNLEGDQFQSVTTIWKIDDGATVALDLRGEQLKERPELQVKSWNVDSILTEHSWGCDPRFPDVNIRSTRNGDFAAKADRALKIVAGTAEQVKPGEALELAIYLSWELEHAPELDPMRPVIESILKHLVPSSEKEAS
jgi:hypothetical protein